MSLAENSTKLLLIIFLILASLTLIALYYFSRFVYYTIKRKYEVRKAKTLMDTNRAMRDIQKQDLNERIEAYHELKDRLDKS